MSPKWFWPYFCPFELVATWGAVQPQWALLPKQFLPANSGPGTTSADRYTAKYNWLYDDGFIHVDMLVELQTAPGPGGQFFPQYIGRVRTQVGVVLEDDVVFSGLDPFNSGMIVWSFWPQVNVLVGPGPATPPDLTVQFRGYF